MDDQRARKIELLQEFNSAVAPQKLRLETLLPDLWRRCYGAPDMLVAGSDAGAAGHGVKRVHEASAFAAPPDSKRVKADDAQRRKDDMFNECMNIVSKKLMGIKASHWFKMPVAPEQSNYFLIVKRPMDLGTVKEKLRRKAYYTPLEVKEDVDQIWTNCSQYNVIGSAARNDGDKCQAVWEAAWRASNIEGLWAQLQLEMNSTMPLHERTDLLNEQLIKAVHYLPLSGPPDALEQRDMVFSEKRRLSIALSKLQAPEQLRAVLGIVAQDSRVSGAAGAVADAPAGAPADGAAASAAAPAAELADELAGAGAASADAAAPAPAEAAAPATAVMTAEGGAEKSAADTTTATGAGENGGTASVQLSASEHSGRHSSREANEVSARAVDQSATAPPEASAFVKDRPTEHKPDVPINTANWSAASLTTEADAGAGPRDKEGEDAQEGGDDMWESFKSMADQKQKEVKEEAETSEKPKQDEAEQQTVEEAEGAEQGEEQKQLELAETDAKAGTANLTPGEPAGMAATTELGLEKEEAD
ncbi:hypothetical protein FOA52_011438 [Chlamydomonas sp. UWO 241]|nr:hypothetical protein FOA52_011438 [Chlamydomonas sp. UWO 241]